ncbi:MAG: ribosome maturation factor RimM [Candidatus Zixiibacteriota bacterium]
MSKPRERVTIGKITRTRGLNGEVVIFPYTDDPDRFFLLKEVWVSGKKDSQLFQIEKAKKFTQKIFLKFQGINSPEAAMPLVNSYLEIEREKLLPLPENRYYIFDIIGLKVFTNQGEEIGTIHNVMSLPANDVYVVKSGEKEYDIPAIKEVVKKIDLDKKIMVIQPLKGLLE